MKTNSEHSPQKTSGQHRTQRGNALIYVLIALALFAALGFTLMRSGDSSEAGRLDEDRAQLYVSQIVSYAAQAKSTFDQMNMQNTRAGQVDFMLPSHSDFNTTNTIHKIYHPDGGGLIPGSLPPAAIRATNITTPADPAPGWYIGRFNNLDWTPRSVAEAASPDYEEIILTAYGLDPLICGLLNKNITGSATIPTMSSALKLVLVDDSHYSTGTNVNMTTTGATPVCAACAGKGALCVQQGGIYAYYNVIAVQ